MKITFHLTQSHLAKDIIADILFTVKLKMISLCFLQLGIDVLLLHPHSFN